MISLKNIGQWSSNTYLVYIQTQIVQLTAGVAIRQLTNDVAQRMAGINSCYASTWSDDEQSNQKLTNISENQSIHITPRALPHRYHLSEVAITKNGKTGVPERESGWVWVVQ
jgi:uncharacterized protein (DUF2461 family)